MVGDQAQQAGAIAPDLSSISDTINRANIGLDPRKKREMMRLGETDPNAFSLQNQDFMQQAQQPSSMIGGGNNTGSNSVYGDNYLMDYFGLRNFKPQEGYTYKDAEYGVGPALTNPQQYIDSLGEFANPENGIYHIGKYDYTRQADNTFKPENTLLNPAGYYNAQNSRYSNVVDNPYGEGLTQETVATPQSANFLAQDILSGRDISTEQYLSSFNADDLIPRNPVRNQLQDIFDPLYQTKTEKEILQYYGSQMGLDANDIERVARAYSAQMPINNSKSGFEMGGASNAPHKLAQAIVDYAQNTHGYTPNQQTLNSLFGSTDTLQKSLQDARAIESHSGGFFDDVLPIASTVLKFTPYAPIAYAYDAYNAVQNHDLLGLGMAAFGGFGGFDALGSPTMEGPMPDGGNLGNQGFFGGVQTDRDLLAQTLGVSPEIAGGIAKGTIQGLGGGLEGALRGGLSSGVGNYAGGLINGMTQAEYGDSIAKMAGGAASGGLNSLFNKNSPVAGSLYGGMSGGLHGFLNSVNQNLTPEDNKFNQGLAQTFSKLALNQIKR